jgi:hypothetical protein
MKRYGLETKLEKKLDILYDKRNQQNSSTNTNAYDYLDNFMFFFF